MYNLTRLTNVNNSINNILVSLFVLPTFLLLFMKQKFVIYRSSAGSGKTYALVRNYIKLALLGDEQVFKLLPTYFSNYIYK